MNIDAPCSSYGFSEASHKPGMHVPAVARAFHALMTETLGYKRYVAQGGDWGSVIAQRLGAREWNLIIRH